MGKFNRIDFGYCTDKIVTTNTDTFILGGKGVDITIGTNTPGLYIADQCTINANTNVYSNIICSNGVIGKEGNKNYFGNIISGYNSIFGTGLSLQSNVIIGPNTNLENVTIGGNVLFGQNSKINRSTLSNSVVWGNILYPYGTNISDNVSTSFYTLYGGLVSFGATSTLNNGQYNGTTLLGQSCRVNDAEINGNAIIGNGCTYNNFRRTYANILMGNNATIGDDVKYQEATWIIARVGDRTQIDKIQYRYGLTLINLSSLNPSYLIYYPKSNYAEANGNLRYGNDMNITDSDGNAIVENGKLLLEDKIKQLEQRIAELESKLG